MFSNYRLRIAEVVRDYRLKARDEAPADSHTAHGWMGRVSSLKRYRLVMPFQSM